MNKTTTYSPISCGFHDELQLASMRRTPVVITFLTEDGEQKLENRRIVDLYARSGEEFLKLDSGEEVRLDRVIAVKEG